MLHAIHNETSRCELVNQLLRTFFEYEISQRYVDMNMVYYIILYSF